jgi:hypothetical protein
MAWASRMPADNVVYWALVQPLLEFKDITRGTPLNP